MWAVIIPSTVLSEPYGSIRQNFSFFIQLIHPYTFSIEKVKSAKKWERQYEHSSLLPTHVVALHTLSDCRLSVRGAWSSHPLYPPPTPYFAGDIFYFFNLCWVPSRRNLELNNTFWWKVRIKQVLEVSVLWVVPEGKGRFMKKKSTGE